MSKQSVRTLLAPACLVFWAATAMAATVSGTITDRTTGKPSAGDTIAVINTAQGMGELSKATSDTQGRFQADAPDGGQILLHVTHKGAEYFKSVPPGSASVDIDVYDSAVKIDGITGEALVMRVESDTNGKTLNIAENFFVLNASAPQRTQYGANTFEFYLPKGAVIGQTLASSPGGLPTNTDVKTVDAASGHYAFTFPVRPGETRFQVAYSMPYSGKQPFQIRLSVATNDVAIMLPKTMMFDGGSQFQPINPDVNALSYDAHQPELTKPVQFTISGTGQLPQDDAQAQGSSGGDQAAGNGAAPAASGTRPGGGLGAPMDPDDKGDPWGKYKWWIISGLGLALIAGAGILLSRSAVPAGTVPTGDLATYPAASDPFATTSVPRASAPTAGLLQTLKDELFELEADRLAGKLTDAEYAEHKAAFDLVLRRALARRDAGTAA